MALRRANDISDGSFLEWARQWMCLATYPGQTLADVDERIGEIMELWNKPIPGTWRRGQDRRLLDPHRRYCRSNYAEDANRRGEHAIEYELLQPIPNEKRTKVMGAWLIDGVNAVPLAKDEAGGRKGNVEADMLLLVRDSAGEHRLEVVEVKKAAANAWFAAVENLRQLRLMMESPETKGLFVHRQPDLGLSLDLPFVGLVLAPHAFYSARGKKRNAVTPALELLAGMRAHAELDVRLGVWDGRDVQPLEASPSGRDS
jgi:hypothetical protein